jgi:DNA-directed RNA polymerase specialized sigma24 family protein
MDRDELLILYQDELPKWEKYIYSYAYRLLSKYRAVIDWSVDIEDITQELRISIWRAVQKYEEIRGSSLSTYIYLLLKNDATTIVQKQYRDHPKKSKEELYQVIPFSGLEKDDTLNLLSYVKDPDNLIDQTIIDQVWFDTELSLIDKIMQPRKSASTKTGEQVNWHERDVLRMLVSGNYHSNQDVCHQLGNINHAKVNEVQNIIRAALCLLNGWDITEFMGGKNLEALVKTTNAKLRKYTSDVYPIDRVLPPEKWINLLKEKEIKETNLLAARLQYENQITT